MRMKFLLGPIPNVTASGIVTVLCLLFFVGLCWFVYRRDRKGIYMHLQSLPLSEDDK